MTSRKPGILYVAQEEGGPSKIGVAVDPAKRIKMLARQCKSAVRLVWSAPHPDCLRVETLVCRLLVRKRHGQFRVEGNREWFDVEPERVIAAAEKAMQILEMEDRVALRKLKAPGHWKRTSGAARLARAMEVGNE